MHSFITIFYNSQYSVSLKPQFYNFKNSTKNIPFLSTVVTIYNNLSLSVDVNNSIITVKCNVQLYCSFLNTLKTQAIFACNCTKLHNATKKRDYVLTNKCICGFSYVLHRYLTIRWETGNSSNCIQISYLDTYTTPALNVTMT